MPGAFKPAFLFLYFAGRRPNPDPGRALSYWTQVCEDWLTKMGIRARRITMRCRRRDGSRLHLIYEPAAQLAWDHARRVEPSRCPIVAESFRMRSHSRARKNHGTENHDAR